MQEPRGSDGGTAALEPALEGAVEGEAVSGEEALGVEGAVLGGEGAVEGEVQGGEEVLKRWWCEKCRKSFPQSGNLNRHRATMHAPKDVKCSKAFCDRVFPTLWDMLLHKVDCRWVCRECFFSTSRAGYPVAGHMRRCAGLP